MSLVLGLAGCSEAPQPKPEETRTVRALTVGDQRRANELVLAGEVRARYETRLAFRVGGKITQRLVEIGSPVRAGQAVARLDPADLALAASAAQSQVAALEVERNLAEADMKRFRELRDKNFISQAEFDRRAAALAAAEAKVEAARAQQRQSANQAAYSTLVADSAGVITAVEAEAGQVVAAGQTVLRLARVAAGGPRPGELEIAVAIPETQRAMVEKARDARVMLSASPGHTWKARLRELAPAADPATRTYAARVALLQVDPAFELGMSAQVAFRTDDGPSRIELPLAALYSRGEQPQVFVIEKGGTVQLRAVKTAGVSEQGVLVASGLSPGDVVVAAGAQLLRPGQKVRVLQEAPTAVMGAEPKNGK
jgi:RND family efflux transporter MFP subunit